MRAWIPSASRWRISTRSGRWRDRDAGKPIDASGVLPDGTKFDGMRGLKKALLVHPSRFVSPSPRSC